jgi:hypothetical protein
MKPSERLTEGLRHQIDEADYAAAVAVNQASAQAASKGGQRNSGTAVLIAQVVEGQMSKQLPSIFRIYNDEREGFWSDRALLKAPVIAAIEHYFVLSQRYMPDQKAFGGSNRGIYPRLLEEACERAKSQAEAHFLHPGLRPWPERNPFWMLVIGALVGAAATALFGGG